MNPGRELDAIVADRVLNWENIRDTGLWSVPGRPDELITLPHFSEEIADAWLVVEETDLLSKYSLAKNGLGDWAVWDADNDTVSISKTAPHAICLAALKAVGYDFKE